jgi:hypothetical protein
VQVHQFGLPGHDRDRAIDARQGFDVLAADRADLSQRLVRVGGREAVSGPLGQVDGLLGAVVSAACSSQGPPQT